MSTGMKVQCSILESPVKNLTESHVKALCGNQLVIPVQYKVRQANFQMTTEYNDDSSWYAGMPYATPAVVWQTLYQYTMAASGTINDATQWSALLASGFTWTSAESPITAPTLQTCNGWQWLTCYPGGGGIPGNVGYLFLALAKNTTGRTQTYFIGRKRGYAYYNSAPTDTVPSGWVLPGVTCTTSLIEIISTGLVQASQVIGHGGDIDLPLPGELPSSLTVNGNCVLTSDQYFAVIGQSPDTWAAAQINPTSGFPAPVTFGPQTAVT